MVLLLLGAIWAAFLLPPVLRARAEHRPHGSIVDFRRQLHVLGRTTPGTTSLGLRAAQPAHRPMTALHAPAAFGLARPTRRPTAAKRRRDVFFGLLAMMALTLVVGLLPPFRFMLVAHVVVDLLFAGYVATLVSLRNLAAEREMKVSFLPQVAQAEPALLLRQSN